MGVLKSCSPRFSKNWLQKNCISNSPILKATVALFLASAFLNFYIYKPFELLNELHMYAVVTTHYST